MSNTTLGMLMATINSSITLIALPDIFRGIGLNPLAPGNVSYLLWMLMGFLVVTAVLVVTFGRIGDMYGRVKMYVLGFAVFTAGSILLSVVWTHGATGASPSSVTARVSVEMASVFGWERYTGQDHRYAQLWCVRAAEGPAEALWL